MTELLREIQLPLLAFILLLGAVAKVADRTGGGAAALLPTAWKRWFTLLNAGLELVVAVALLALAGWAGDLARGTTALLFALALAVLVQLRRRSPDSGCGCFGGLSVTPVGWRTMLRAGLLGAAALTTIGVPGSGIDAAAGFTAWHWALAGVELVLVAALSPELGEFARRILHRPSCEVREVPLGRTMAALRASEVWQANSSMLDSTDPTDVWRQGCRRLLRFDGRRGGRDVHVVFAVAVTGRRPPVRAVIVDAATGLTVATLGVLDPVRPPPRTREGIVPFTTRV